MTIAGHCLEFWRMMSRAKIEANPRYRVVHDHARRLLRELEAEGQLSLQVRRHIRRQAEGQRAAGRRSREEEGERQADRGAAEE